MHVWGMGADIARVGIVGQADIALIVMINQVDDVLVVQADEPSRTQFGGRGKGLPVRRGQARGKVLGLLHEGGVRRAVERKRHALGCSPAMVLEDLQCDAVDRHRSTLRFENKISITIDGDQETI